jgi:hypothetical protein
MPPWWSKCQSVETPGVQQLLREVGFLIDHHCTGSGEMKNLGSLGSTRGFLARESCNHRRARILAQVISDLLVALASVAAAAPQATFAAQACPARRHRQ